MPMVARNSHLFEAFAGCLKMLPCFSRAAEKSCCVIHARQRMLCDQQERAPSPQRASNIGRVNIDLPVHADTTDQHKWSDMSTRAC